MKSCLPGSILSVVFQPHRLPGMDGALDTGKVVLRLLVGCLLGLLLGRLFRKAANEHPGEAGPALVFTGDSVESSVQVQKLGIRQARLEAGKAGCRCLRKDRIRTRFPGTHGHSRRRGRSIRPPVRPTRLGPPPESDPAGSIAPSRCRAGRRRPDSLAAAPVSWWSHRRRTSSCPGRRPPESLGAVPEWAPSSASCRSSGPGPRSRRYRRSRSLMLLPPATR